MQPFKTYNANQENLKSTSQLNGDEKLCRAVILQALMDIAKPQTTTSRKRWKEIAKRWIMSDNDCPWSFLWCVQYGFNDEDYDCVVEVVRKNIKEINHGKFWNRLLRRSSVRRLGD